MIKPIGTLTTSINGVRYELALLATGAWRISPPPPEDPRWEAILDGLADAAHAEGPVLDRLRLAAEALASSSEPPHHA